MDIMKLKFLTAASMACAVAVAGISSAAADEFKLGLVTFLSGGGSGPFGVPAKNAGVLSLRVEKYSDP